MKYKRFKQTHPCRDLNVTPQERFSEVVKLYSNKQYDTMLERANQLAKEFPNEFEIWNVIAAGYRAIGLLREAEFGFRRAAQLNPSFAEASYNLGVVLHEQGKLAEAIEEYRRAITVNPEFASAHYNMGNAQRDCGELDEALNSYLRATSFAPNYAEAYNNIGGIYKRQKKIAEATESFRRATSINPTFAEAHYNFATVLHEECNFPEAICEYRISIDLDPTQPAPHKAMISALRNSKRLDEAVSACNYWSEILPNEPEAQYLKGNVLAELGRYNEAIAAFRSAIRLAPDDVDQRIAAGMALEKLSRFDEALAEYRHVLKTDEHNFDALVGSGNALMGLNEFEDAIHFYHAALKINQNSASLLSNLGIALHQLAEFDAAVDCFIQSVKIDPELATAHKNLGISMQDKGKLEEAIVAFKKSLELAPNEADTYYGLGQAYLAKGDFEAGFQLCEWRWKTGQIGQPIKSSKPTWTGQPGKKVLLWSEQGVGDEIMFSSVIPDIFGQCSDLIVQCDTRLIPLFKRSFSPKIRFRSRNELVNESEYEFHISMGSALGIFRKRLSCFENSASSFLKCDTAVLTQIRSALNVSGSDKLIGISWTTQSTKRASQLRNIDLRELAGALQRPGVVLVSLQYGEVSHEIAQLKEVYGLSLNELPTINNRENIDGLSALISACDHVVSIDNATVHLAGALGVDTRVLLPCNPDWRWGIEKKASYWYRSVALYRQVAPRKWDQAIDRLKLDLFGALS